MNKHLITLAIAVLLICVGLSGCIQQQESTTIDIENNEKDDNDEYLAELDALYKEAEAAGTLTIEFVEWINDSHHQLLGYANDVWFSMDTDEQLEAINKGNKAIEDYRKEIGEFVFLENYSEVKSLYLNFLDLWEEVFYYLELYAQDKESFDTSVNLFHIAERKAIETRDTLMDAYTTKYDHKLQEIKDKYGIE